MSQQILAQDNRVRVRRLRDTDWCYGHVALASANGRSVAISLNGMVRTADGGGIAGVLPLIVDDEAETVTGLDGTEYEVEVQ